jgi:hypothetical protein
LISRRDVIGCSVATFRPSQFRRRVSEHPGESNVLVERREIPAQWPEATFDLIVLSEFLCFASNDAIRQTAAKAKSCLMPDGAILMCHWRHPMQHGDIMADEVHSLFSNALQLPRVVRYEETDFLLEVWTDDGRSVAALEKEGALS